MSRREASPRAPIRRALTQVRAATTRAHARPAYATGLRAAIGTVAPLLLDHALGFGGGIWISLAGFSGALADKGGPYRTRAATLGALTAAGAAVAGLGALAAGHPGLAIPLAFVVALLCSLGRAYGDAGASVGVTVLLIFVISLGFPSAGPADALWRAGFTVVGGVWAMLLALVLWPLRPYRPVRIAVAEVYRAVADYADRLSGWTRTGAVPNPVPVRAALETARAALATVRRGRSGPSGRGERLVVLGEMADRLFGNLFGLSDVAETIAPSARRAEAQDALAGAADALAASARAIADRIEAEEGTVPVPAVPSGDGLRATLPRPAATEAEGAAAAEAGAEGELAGAAEAGPVAHYREVAGLLDRIAQYADLAAASAAGLNDGSPLPAIERPREVEDPELRPPVLAPLRAVLAPDSIVLRHALRVGLVTAGAVALTLGLGLERGYWVTLTAVIILQPYAGATSQRALQRVLGTIVGGVLTAAIAARLHDPLAILGLAFAFSGVSVALLPLNYAAFSVFLTPTFVLLAEASAGDWHLAGLRIVNTLIGGALAYAGSRLLWPTPEVDRLPGYFGAVLVAMRRYVEIVVARFDDRSDAGGRALRAARRDVGLAILNADESLQRALGEQRGSPDELSSLMTLITYARRFTASIAALALSRHAVTATGAGAPGGDALAPFARAVMATLDDLAAALAEGRPPAPLADTPAPADGAVPPLLRGRIGRLARQLPTLHDAVDRWSRRSGPDERTARAAIQSTT